jgi:glycogen debranching enzyme
MTPEDRTIIEDIAAETKTELDRHFFPGFGVFPSADPDDNYYNQLWCRDFAHAAGNYFILANPQAVLDSLKTIFKYQEKKGGLPFRIEREYAILKIFPGMDRFSKPIFNFFEHTLRRRNERPLYEGRDMFDAGDTIPVILITIGDFYNKTDLGKTFVKEYFDQIKKAADYFFSKCDPKDGLALIKGPYPDWADTIKKSGKLGTINIWWVRALEHVAMITRERGDEENAKRYQKECDQLKTNILLKVYDANGSYFRSMVGSSRLSTVASIFGSYYILDATQAARVEETLNKRVLHKSGFKNFDPPYPLERIMWTVRLAGHAGYHNIFVWPWVTLQNIQVKIKIAQDHPDQATKDRYKNEAIADLVKIAKLFKDAGGAYEIFMADEPKPGGGILYKSARNFMGNLAGFQGAYNKLKSLGWILI